MAGGGEAEDNPLPINVVPMVDIIFCLCVFFMCSFKFRETEGKFDSWLPKDKGEGGDPDPGPLMEMRVIMTWDQGTGKLTRAYMHRQVKDDAELEQLVREAHEDFVAKNKPEIPLIIDGGAAVPWKEIMTVVNIGKALQIKNLEFAMGAADTPQSK
jgi:biopolymer transport protein ExbD